MPEVRTFKVGGRVADVPAKDLDGFLKAYPGAKEVKTYIVGKDTADVPLEKIDGFLKEYPSAKPMHGGDKLKQNIIEYQDVKKELPETLVGRYLQRGIKPKKEKDYESGLSGIIRMAKGVGNMATLPGALLWSKAEPGDYEANVMRDTDLGDVLNIENPVGDFVASVLGDPVNLTAMGGGLLAGRVLGKRAARKAMRKVGSKATSVLDKAPSLESKGGKSILDDLIRTARGETDNLKNVKLDVASKGEMPKIKVKLGNKSVQKPLKDIKTVVESNRIKIDLGDNIKTETLNLESSERVTFTMLDVMKKHGVKWDKSKYARLSDQFLDENLIDKVDIEDLKKHGYDNVAQFLREAYRTDVRLSAQKMNRLSQVSKVIDKVEKVGAATTKDIKSKWNMMDATFNIMKRIDNIRRGLLVSKLSTAMRNLFSQAGRIGLDVADDALETSLGKITKRPSYNDAKFEDSLKLFTNLFKHNKKLVKDILHYWPKEYDKMFHTYASDVVRAKGGKDALAKIEKGVEYLNWANKWQEYTIRRAAFVGKLNEVLTKRGLNFTQIYDDVLKTERKYLSKYGKEWRNKITHREAKALREKIGQIRQMDIEKAVDYSLEMTFAQNPTSELGNTVLKLVNSMPMLPSGTGTFPFIRFAMNAVKFNFRHSPLGALRLMKPGTNKLRTISEAMTGSTLFVMAHQLRNSQYAGEKWYEVKVGKNYYDTRAYNPFAAYLFIADVYKKWREGSLHKMTFKEWSMGVIGSNLRAGTGLYMLDKLVDSLANEKSWNRFTTMAQEYTGELIGGFASPIQQIHDFIAEFEDTHAKMRDTKEQPLWGPTKSRIPFLSTQLPERESPTRKEAPKKDAPLLYLLTGVLKKGDKNIVEKEIDRLGFSYPEVFPNTGDRKANRLILKYMGEFTEDRLIDKIKSDTYQKASDAKKGIMLKKFLEAARAYGKAKATREDRDLFLKLKQDRTPRRKKRFLEELNK